MPRRRSNEIRSLEDRLAEQAKRFREKARKLKPGPDREMLLRQARQAEAGSHISEWLRSPELRSPK